MHSILENILLDFTEKDFLKTQKLIFFLEDQYDHLNDYIKKSISHIINYHHAVHSRIERRKIESELWDVLPCAYWERLLNQNYLATKNIIHTHFVSESDLNKLLEINNILHQLFEHNTHHRAQILYNLKENKLNIPNLNMILIQ